MGEAAKRARRPFKDAKPVPDPIEKSIPRPKATDTVEGMEESGPESEEEEDVEINSIGLPSPDPTLNRMFSWRNAH